MSWVTAGLNLQIAQVFQLLCETSRMGCPRCCRPSRPTFSRFMTMPISYLLVGLVEVSLVLWIAVVRVVSTTLWGVETLVCQAVALLGPGASRSWNKRIFNFISWAYFFCLKRECKSQTNLNLLDAEFCLLCPPSLFVSKLPTSKFLLSLRRVVDHWKWVLLCVDLEVVRCASGSRSLMFVIIAHS